MNTITIGRRTVGPGRPVMVVAELAGNHGGDFERAARMVEAACAAGADAVKLQTFTPDTITFDGDREELRLPDGSTLFQAYSGFTTPWEWHERLARVAADLGMELFSSPFSPEAVDFLAGLDMPAYKIASFELVDLPLIRRAARQGRPLVMSTGMATLGEIEEAVDTARGEGCEELILLKCTSSYPAPPEEMNLRTMAHMAAAFDLPVGLSDHTTGIAVPVGAVALGAVMVEKHFIMSRADGGPESGFALEPAEFKAMVDAVRVAERALGAVHYGLTEKERASRIYRRSLFVVEDVRAGEALSPSAVRSIRPAHGLHPRYLDEVVGRRARCDLAAGTPLSWQDLD